MVHMLLKILVLWKEPMFNHRKESTLYELYKRGKGFEFKGAFSGCN